MRLVDLSHPLVSGMQVYPGDPPVSVRPALTLAADGAAVAFLHLGTHSGTHVDAPSHSVVGGASVDEVDLGLFVGPAVVVDVTGRAPSERVGWDAFAAQVPAFGPGVVDLVRFGWDVRFGARGYLQHPWLAREVAERLVDAGVRTLGVDTLSPDRTPPDPAQEDFAVHEVVLGAGGVVVENLRGLGAPAGMSQPWVSLLPLRVDGGDGSPVRAVAWDAGPGVSGC